MIIHDPHLVHDAEPTDRGHLPNSRQPERGLARDPSEGLFAFVRQHDRFTCELRTVGRWGIEARFLRNQQFLYSRRHKTRELAVAWAEAERKALEGNPHYRDDLKPLAWPGKPRPAPSAD